MLEISASVDGRDPGVSRVGKAIEECGLLLGKCFVALVEVALGIKNADLGTICIWFGCLDLGIGRDGRLWWE